MRFGRSPLPLLLGVAFALWSPLPSVSGSSKGDCITVAGILAFCGMSHETFYYNVTTKSCERYFGTICSREIATYSTLKECHQFCSGTDFCELPPDHGSCDLKLQRWFYDPKADDCKLFTFGGCNGNLNNFNSAWICRLVCHFRGSP